MMTQTQQSQIVAQEQVQAAILAGKLQKMPPAGPHDRPELTNFDACPGAGALPSQEEMGWESDPGAG